MNRKKIIFLIFVFILFFGNYGWGITEVLLTRDKVVVSDTNVYLGDIAEIKGDLEHTLVTLRIITAPGPGKTKVLDKKYIQLRLKQSGFDIQEVKIEGFNSILIEGAYQRISKKVVEDLIRERVRDVIPEWVKQFKIMINIPNFDDIAPIGDLDIFIEIPQIQKISGSSFSVPVSININGARWKKFYTTVKTILYADVPVAITSMKRGEKITKKDYKIEKREIRGISFPYISPSEVEGFITLRNIYPGTIIDLTYLSKPYQVKRGQIVEVLFIRGAITIRLKAQALNNGFYGDVVELKNLKSGKKFSGIVKDYGFVIVR